MALTYTEFIVNLKRALLDSALFIVILGLGIQLAYHNRHEDGTLGNPAAPLLDSHRPYTPRYTPLYSVVPFHDWDAVRQKIYTWDPVKTAGKYSCNPATNDTDPSGCTAYLPWLASLKTASKCSTVDEALWPDGCTCIVDMAEKLATASAAAQRQLTLAEKTSYTNGIIGCMLRGQMPSEMHYKDNINIWNQLLTLYAMAAVLNVFWAPNGEHGEFTFVTRGTGMLLFILYIVFYVLNSTKTNSVINDMMFMLMHGIIFVIYGCTYWVVTQFLRGVNSGNDEVYYRKFQDTFRLGWFTTHALPQYCLVIACLRGWTDIEMIYYIITLAFFIGNFLVCAIVFRWVIAVMHAENNSEPAHTMSLLSFSFFMLVFAIFAYAWTNFPLLRPGGNELYILLSMAFIAFLAVLIFGADIMHAFSKSQFDIEEFWNVVSNIELVIRIAFFIIFTMGIFGMNKALNADGTPLLVT